MTDYFKELHMAKHIDTIISKQDNVVKYVFEKNFIGTPYIFEVSYINKADGRYILCVPTQSMCHMGCKFCHTTDYIGKIPLQNIDPQTLVSACYFVMDDLNLLNNDKIFLLSFMGCGEPLENMHTVLETINNIKDVREFGKERRFAIATSIPRKNWLPLMKFANELTNPEMIKLHFSMHYTTDEVRKQYMPKTLELEKAFQLLDTYKHFTDSEIELHYAMIDGVNDTVGDLNRLIHFTKDRDFKVKLLHYNKREALNKEKSTELSIRTFKKTLESYNIKTTYYIPPGLDVGASCGQFLMDHYIKANLKKEEC